MLTLFCFQQVIQHPLSQITNISTTLTQVWVIHVVKLAGKPLDNQLQRAFGTPAEFDLCFDFIAKTGSVQQLVVDIKNSQRIGWQMPAHPLGEPIKLSFGDFNRPVKPV